MLIAMTITRNSSWIIEACVKCALEWCDAVVALDHASVDDTGRILDSLAAGTKRVHVLHEPNPIWLEMAHRQRTLDAARSLGATRFANVDDDEILTRNLYQEVRSMSDRLAHGGVLNAPLISVWDRLETFRDDHSQWSGCYTNLVFRDKAGMSYQPACDGYQYHSRRPHGADGPTMDTPSSGIWKDGGILHLQFASARRLKAKQALYKMREVVHYPGRMSVEMINAMYDQTTRNEPAGSSALPANWLEPHVKSIDFDAEPWQEAECKRLWSGLGREAFKGLDLYGVVE